MISSRLRTRCAVGLRIERSFYSTPISEEMLQAVARLNKPNYYQKVMVKNPHLSNLSRASVLVLISDRQVIDPVSSKTVYQPCFTLCKRSENLNSYGGQTCFAGGRRDAEIDKDDIDTACREAYEEIGVIRDDSLRILAELCPVVTTNGTLVTPVVAYVNKSTASPLKLNPSEVDLVFDVPTDIFLSRRCHRSRAIKSYYLHHFKLNCSDVYEVQRSRIVDNDAFYKKRNNKQLASSSASSSLPSTTTGNLHVIGFTAFMCIYVSSVLHQRKPEFSIDPVSSFDPAHNGTQFLEDYLLVKSRDLVFIHSKFNKVKSFLNRFNFFS